MSAPRPVFLAAQWQYLAMINYAVPAEILQPHLPKGTELDLWQGEAMVSMVGFLFNHTRVFGIHWPLHTHFEEVNLRLYVRHWDGEKWKRGVAFVSEIVPRPAIAIIANALYNEHYRYMPTRHQIQQQPDTLNIHYGWKYKGAWNTMNIVAKNQLQPIANGSIEHFILEHYWGYNQLNQQTIIEYGVEHEPWQVYPVLSHSFDCNVSGIYGPQWVPYLQAQPHSVMLAHGSKVIVRKPIQLHV